MQINFNPIVRGVDLIFLANDQVNVPVLVKDQNGNPINFSGTTNFTNYTGASLVVKTNEVPPTITLQFNSSGATYQIDMSQRAVGVLTFKCNALALAAGSYQYNLSVFNKTNRITICSGKFDVTADI